MPWSNKKRKKKREHRHSVMIEGEFGALISDLEGKIFYDICQTTLHLYNVLYLRIM
ncbi:hypothetical protein DsansV1_C05g0056201 [Dioscorea sansibarensis]